VDLVSDEIGDVLAGEIYVNAGLDPSQAPGALRVATAVLGSSCLHAVARHDLPGRALLQRSGGLWVIYYRESLNSRQLNHAIAHELGEWFLRCRGYADSDVEDLSSRVAAAICVPRPAFMPAHRQYGEDLTRLSQSFAVSESLMALRIAECLGLATALITRRVVRTRGEAHDWPSTPEGWKELVAHAREHPNGLSVRNVSDSKGRVILRFG